MSCNSESAKKFSFRSLMVNLSQHLKEERLQEFKCLCRYHIGIGRLEKTVTSLELFTLLEERDIISENRIYFLLFCLSQLGLINCVKLVHDFIAMWIAPKNNKQNCTKQTTTVTFTDSAEDANKNDAQPFYDDYTESTTYSSRTNAPLSQTQSDFISFMALNLSSNNWKSTMRYLGIDEDIIAAADYTWPNDLRRQIRETLEYWIRAGGIITRESAMAATTLAGREDLAQELHQKFPYI